MDNVHAYFYNVLARTYGFAKGKLNRRAEVDKHPPSKVPRVFAPKAPFGILTSTSAGSIKSEFTTSYRNLGSTSKNSRCHWTRLALTARR